MMMKAYKAEKVKKLEKNKKLKEQIPIEMAKTLNIDIAQTKKDKERLEKELEERKKTGKYSLKEPEYCLAYGEINVVKMIGPFRMITKKLSPVLVYCDKKRRLDYLADFRDDWKVIDLPDDENKYAILTGKGNKALTKRKINEKNRQAMSELYDPKYFINFGNECQTYLGLENNVVDNNYQTEQDPPDQ